MILSLSFKSVLLCIFHYKMSLRTKDFWLLISSVENIGIMKGTRFIRLQNMITSSLRDTSFFKYREFRMLITIGINKS